MKQLFVTHISKTKKKEERHEIFKCCERKEEKIDNNENCPLMNIQENPSNPTLSSSSSSTTNSSIDPQKISFNIFITEPQITVNTNYSVNSNSSNLKNLLGKKTKVHFDIIKNEDIKGISSSSNNYNFNNLNLNLNISNSQSLDGSIINKEIDKNDESLEFIEEKGDINDNLSINRKEEKKEYLNTGRWSYKEHIKFIEAIAEYGKNWKDVQKYVGSRSSAQARSHAQKFFLKLKAIKNPKFDFDFSSNNIKSLLDIIEIIKKNKEYYIRGKEYIINTLITLSESISSENNNDDLCKTIYIKNLKKELNENNELILNNNKELKFDIINIHNDNSKKVKFKNKKCLSIKDKDKENKNIKSKTNDSIIGDDMNNDMNNNSIVNNNINDSNSLNYSTTNVSMNKEHKNLEKINDIDINQIEEDIVDNIKEENEININDFFGEIKKKKIIFDDGIMYFSDDSEFFDMNNISLKMKEYFFLQNFESPNFLYNKYFFS
jgi:SHAQKYF class myb-like DNA-binding protein